MKRVSIFLITAALIAGMAGCAPVQYDLTISSTEGGSVTDPGERTFTYDSGTVVNLVAAAEEGYSFVNWTGDVGTIADVEDATTNITMNGHYSITANFDKNLEIRTWYDLDAIRDNLGGNHILMNDLDPTTPGYQELANPTANGGKGWEPIGWGYWASGCDEPFGKIFKGTFDGQGHEIRDLFINRNNEVGLFGFVGKQGIIKDIGVINATVIGSYGVDELMIFDDGTIRTLDIWTLGNGDAVGVLVGWNDGTVSNSYSSGNVTGERYVGGLVGFNEGILSNSYACSNVTGDESVGGLAGANVGILGALGIWGAGTVSNSYYNYDEVTINGENIITIGALFAEDFEEWLANDKFLDINDRLSQENSYYVVNNVTDFQQLLAFGQNATLKFRLTNDLDLATEPNFYIPYLAGEFDGNGRNISNLSFNFDFVSQVGLFGCLASGGKVTQVGVENVNITGYDCVGGLVGGNDEGTVSNSYSSGSVIGTHRVGGLVGWNYGSVSESYFIGSVTGYGGGGGAGGTGGLVGYNRGTVSNSYSTGTVTGHYHVGGLGGDNWGTVSNSYSTGSVTGDEHVGGLVGYNHGGYYVGTVSNSFWDTETSGQATSDGGTGKNTPEMQYIATFSGAGWNIITVGGPGARNPSYIWNIVTGVTYPFLSWQ